MPSPPSSAGLHAVTSRQCAWPANPDDEAAGYAAEQRQWELEARRRELSPGGSMFDAEISPYGSGRRRGIWDDY